MATIYHGADVSRYQGIINWASYAASKDFVIIKAAGADVGLYVDSQFNNNRTGARAQAGLRIGYYFFGDRRIDPATCANFFINTVGALNSGEILALDIEGANYPNDDWAFTFVTAIYNNYGFYPFCYMSQFSPTSGILAWPTTAPLSPLWMANYGLSSTDFSQTTGNADGNWDTGNVNPRYRILQYTSSGSVAGISTAVDLDTFYSPNNTLNDWNTFGFSAGPPPLVNGSLTVATVTQPTMTYTQPSKQAYLPTETYDQVLFSTKFVTTANITSGSINIPGPSTGLTQYAYPIGNYTFNIDGQSNLNDFGFINAGDFGQYPGVLPTIVVQPIVGSDGSLSFDVSYTPGGAATVKLEINIALMAYPLTTNVNLSTTSQSIARSSAIAEVSPGPYSTYRRISNDLAVGTGSGTYTHGLNTIPNILYWVQDNTGTLEPQPVAWASDGHTSAFGLSMDSTTVYSFVDVANNSKVWLRVYKDN